MSFLIGFAIGLTLVWMLISMLRHRRTERRITEVESDVDKLEQALDDIAIVHKPKPRARSSANGHAGGGAT